MAQCYTICQKWPSHAIGWPRQGTNSIRDAKWSVCVSEGSLIRHKDSQGRHTSLMLTLSRKWRSIRSLHQHSCVWNANPTKSQASMACYALSCSLLCSMYYAKLSYMSASKWGSKLSSTRTLLLLHLPFSPLALFTFHGVWGLGMEGWVKLCKCVWCVLELMLGDVQFLASSLSIKAPIVL